jgi:Mlc titration factor MtfA (ptsG expression regulator)
MTLPLIYALNNCSDKEKSWCINSIKNYNKDKKRVKEVIQFVKDKNETDKINLALHELAHAFYIQNFHGKIVREWEEWKWVAERELGYLRNYSEDNFFRTYAKTNLHEFWAVCVECFFEAPVEFKKRYDRLYSSTAKVLKQDMVKRKVKVQDKLA